MTKKQIEVLQAKANKLYADVILAIIGLTAENPLVLFDSSKVDEDDELRDNLYDFPYGYFVSKHGFYVQGAIMKVKGNNVTLFLTGEDWGDTHELEVDELPYSSLVELLTYIKERE